MKIYYGILAVLLVMAGCAKPETPNGFIDADIFLNLSLIHIYIVYF